MSGQSSDNSEVSTTTEGFGSRSVIFLVHDSYYSFIISAQRLYRTVLNGDKNRFTRQRNMARDLMIEGGLGDHVGPCSLDELHILHATSTLRQYHITVGINSFYLSLISSFQVFSSEYNLLRVYDEGSGTDIHLLHHNNHYSIVTTLPGFFGRSYYCVVCKQGYNNKRQHAKCGRKLVLF